MNETPASESRLLIARLGEALEHLSWPADRQRQYLGDLDVAPSLDELVLEFDDALKPIAAQFHELGFDEIIQGILASIDAKLTEMPESDWKWAALDGDSQWSEIRDLAMLAWRRVQERGVDGGGAR